MADYSLDGNGPPRSSAPCSLGDLFKIKPGRNKSHRGVKSGLETLTTEDDSKVFIGDSFEPREIMACADEFVPMDCLTAHPSMKIDCQSFPWQSKPVSSVEQRDTPVEHIEDGVFHSETLDNGDLSIYQWSQEQQKWTHQGLIGQSNVSLFTRFYDRSYSDHHSNPESWKLYKEHIVAVIKGLSQQRPGAAVSDRVAPSLPIQPSRPIDEQRQNRYIKSESEETEHFPPLPTVSDRTATTNSNTTKDDLRTTRQVNRQSQIPQLHTFMPSTAFNLAADYQSNYTRRDPELDEIRTREVYGELERKRIQQSVLQQHQHDNIATMGEIPIPRFPPTKSAQFLRQPQLPAEPARMGFPSQEQDLRRTVLHDPMKVPLSLHSRTKQDHIPTRNLDFGTAESAKTFYPRNNKSAAPIFYSTLQELVEVSELEPLPPKQLHSFAGANGALVRRFGCVPEPHPVLGQQNSLEISKPNRRLFGQESNDVIASRSYEEFVESFWYSGTKRYQSYERQINRMIAQSNESSGLDAVIGIRALLPAYESLAAYQLSRQFEAAGETEYFASFSKPPSGAVDRVLDLGKPSSLFDEDGPKTPEREFSTQVLGPRIPSAL